MNRTVLVMARHDSTGLGVIRSLGKAGYEVHLLGSAYKKGALRVAASSMYVKEYIEVVQPSAADLQDGLLVSALTQYASSHSALLPVVLFPTDDFSLYVIDRNREILSGSFLLPSASTEGGSLLELMDKQVQGRLASTAGLQVPREWGIGFGDGSPLPTDLVYPCFCKHSLSLRGQKRDMGICRNAAELQAHLSRMAARYGSGKLLVQEYLDIRQEYDLSGVCADDQVILPGLIRKERISLHEQGVTLSGTLLPLEVLGDSADPLRTFLRSLHYRGMFDLELNVTENGIYFGEINLRSGGPSYAYRLCGIDLPDRAVRAICGESVEPAAFAPEDLGKTLVNERVAWEDAAYGFLSRKELDRLLRDSDLLLMRDETDRRPEKSYRYMCTKMRLHAKLRTILGYQNRS